MRHLIKYLRTHADFQFPSLWRFSDDVFVRFATTWKRRKEIKATDPAFHLEPLPGFLSGLKDTPSDSDFPLKVKGKTEKSRKQNQSPQTVKNTPLTYEKERRALFTYNKTMTNYARKGKVDRLQYILAAIRHRDLVPDIYTFTSMMHGYCKAGNTSMVFDLLHECHRLKITPAAATYGVAINACALTGDLPKAMDLLEEMRIGYKIQPTSVTYCQLLKVCAAAKDLASAKKVMRIMHKAEMKGTHTVYTSLLKVYAACTTKANGNKHLQEAWALIDSMRENDLKIDIWICNVLIKICNKADLLKATLSVMSEMRRLNIEPDLVTYTELMNGYIKTKRLKPDEIVIAIEQIQAEMKEKRIEPGIYMYTALLNSAIVLRDLKLAKELFIEMRQSVNKPNAVTYGTMIKCYEKLGDQSKADVYLGPMYALLKEMRRKEMKVAPEVYVTMLSACGNVGDFQAATALWRQFRKDNEKPALEAFSAMIKTCLSVHDVTMATSLLTEMHVLQVMPDDVLLHQFLLYLHRHKHKIELPRVLEKLKLSLDSCSDKTKTLFMQLETRQTVGDGGDI